MAKIYSKAYVKEQYESYNKYFIEVIHRICTILSKNIKLSAQPTYKSRVKSFESYYKKVLRIKQNQTSENNELIFLTDMMGIRMICAFLEDINIAVEQIKQHFDVQEVEIKGAEKKFSEFGYESVHVLITIPDECKPELTGPFEGLKPLPPKTVAEIQIRTILQDAWAEVEHELIYKTEFSPFDKPLRRKLASINASLTLADITFQEIRDYQNKLQKALETRRNSFYDMADNLLDSHHAAVNEKKSIQRISPFVQGTIDDMLLQAIQLHNSGELQPAIDIYTRILEEIPSTEKNIISVITKHRGMAYFSKNQFEKALEDFETSIQNDEKAFRSYYYKGIVYSIQKKYHEAIECFTKSLELNNFQAHTTFRRAMAYYEIQEYEKSMNDLDNSLKLGMSVEDTKVLQEKLVKKFGLSM